MTVKKPHRRPSRRKAKKLPKAPVRPLDDPPAGVSPATFAFLGDRSLPLLEIVNQAMANLFGIRNADTFDNRLKSIEAAVAPRLMKMINSKNDAIAMDAIRVVRDLRQINMSRDLAMISYGEKAIEALTMRVIAEMQAEALRAGIPGGALTADNLSGIVQQTVDTYVKGAGSHADGQ